MALAVDKHGSVYVTGGVTRNNTGLDYTTIKYDCNGSKVWEKTYNGPATNADQASAIALDNKDNVYVTGKSRGCGTQDDFISDKIFSGAMNETKLLIWAALFVQDMFLRISRTASIANCST
ncbi:MULTISPECIES: SBBP repeat-containing protein [Niastella]|uniref:SBBP repeat-containing protein n=1 Tax=Niastella TaxID=354354 RepID=UPI001F2B9008|nr:SBBP repeat-containing protein [Niastella soli]